MGAWVGVCVYVCVEVWQLEKRLCSCAETKHRTLNFTCEINGNKQILPIQRFELCLSNKAKQHYHFKCILKSAMGWEYLCVISSLLTHLYECGVGWEYALHKTKQKLKSLDFETLYFLITKKFSIISWNYVENCFVKIYNAFQ